MDILSNSILGPALGNRMGRACRLARTRGRACPVTEAWIAVLLLVCSRLASTCTASAEALAPHVIDYLNLDSLEATRQAALQKSGLQRITTVLVPEPGTAGAAVTGGIPFFGWPEAALVDDTLIVQARRWHHENDHGDRRPDRGVDASVLRLRSMDGGATWESPVPVPSDYGKAETGITATREGKFIAGKYVSSDRGESWTPAVLAKIARSTVDHPDYGLVTVLARQRGALLLYVAESESRASREIRIPEPRMWDIIDPAVPVWGDGGIAIFARTFLGPISSGGHLTRHWSYYAQFTPTNRSPGIRFEDLQWRGNLTNIFNRNTDSADARYNPVSKRVEAVVTKRAEGFPCRDDGYMTLNLWSIDPEDLARGSPYWRYECTLLRSRGHWRGYDKTTTSAAGLTVRDGMHPYGTVIDTKRGVQYIFIYAGSRIHGGPDQGRTGLFHLSRSLRTEALRQQVRQLDNFQETFGLSEDFATLQRWRQSGRPFAYQVDPADREVARVLSQPLPRGSMRGGAGGLSVTTEAAGYYGLHNTDTIVTHNYRVEWRSKISRYARTGDSLGVSITYAAQKQDIILRPDGIYALDSTGETRRVAPLAMDEGWHEWTVEMHHGRASIRRDGQFVGSAPARIDDQLGGNDAPISIYVRTTSATDPVEVSVSRFKLENIQ